MEWKCRYSKALSMILLIAIQTETSLPNCRNSNIPNKFRQCFTKFSSSNSYLPWKWPFWAKIRVIGIQAMGLREISFGGIHIEGIRVWRTSIWAIRILDFCIVGISLKNECAFWWCLLSYIINLLICLIIYVFIEVLKAA